MNFLLDTYALLWWLNDNPKISAQAHVAISDPNSEIYVSAASAWEISIKSASGKLTMGNPLEDEIILNNFQSLPITIAHATSAGQLPVHHNDPFDRMLIAQAMLENLTLVTRDEQIMRYDVATLIT